MIARKNKKFGQKEDWGDRQQKMADRKKRGLIRQKKKETWGRTEKGKKNTKRRGLIDVSKKMVDRKKFGNGEYVCVQCMCIGQIEKESR